MGSFAGGPEDIDEQLHRLNKDYNQLMDRYRRLKQLKKTPERDLEMDGLLKVRGRAAQEESCISVHTEERPEKVLEFFFFLIKKKTEIFIKKKKSRQILISHVMLLLLLLKFCQMCVFLRNSAPVQFTHYFL